MFKPSNRTEFLKQSGIRAASTRCASIGGINLGQGVCDLPIPDPIKHHAYSAIEHDKSLYSACEGLLPLRQALAKKLSNFNHLDYDPHSEIIITHGSTGAFVSLGHTLFNPGDEAILFEPFYGYHKNILELIGVTTKTIAIDLNDYSVDYQQLQQIVTPKTKAIIVCSPNNPTGKVFSKQELLTIGQFAKQHNLYIITDEIYEYITYPGFEHVSIASLEDFKQRTITISGFSKTYNMTGWRMGYAAGPKEIIEKMALVQDLLYVCPATPLQHACLEALSFPEQYYLQMRDMYLEKRDLVVSSLTNMGFKVTNPQGAYYIMADIRGLGFKDDDQAVSYLLNHAKVAAVTGHSFYKNPEHGKYYLRFCYALNEQQVAQALQQMKQALQTCEIA